MQAAEGWSLAVISLAMPAEACWGSSMDAVDGIEFSLEGANSMRPWRWCDGVDGAGQVSLVNLKGCLRLLRFAGIARYPRTGREVMNRANVFAEKQVQRPIEGHANLLVQARQFAQANRAP